MGQYDGKPVLMVERAQAGVNSGMGNRIWRAGIGLPGLPEQRFMATIDLRCRNPEISLQPLISPQLIVEAHLRDDVGFVPLRGIAPAFGDHSLSGEVDNHLGLELLDGLNDNRQIAIDIGLNEAVAPRRRNFAIRQKNGRAFRRAIESDDLRTFPQRASDENGAGEGIAAKDGVATESHF